MKINKIHIVNAFKLVINIIRVEEKLGKLFLRDDIVIGVNVEQQGMRDAHVGFCNGHIFSKQISGKLHE